MAVHYISPRNNIILYYLILIIFLFNKFSLEITTCPKNLPIIFTEKCNLIYCSKEQFQRMSNRESNNRNSMDK